MNWNNLRRKVLEKYYPEEEEKKEQGELFNEISEYIREEEGLNTFFAGSSGRGTFMKGDKDIDVFVLFPEDVEREELEQRGLEIGEKVFEEFDGEYEVEYAEHPYTKGVIGGHEVEIVPCYDTDPEDIQSAVDRSPHHAQWVRQNLTEEQREDVVILKAFLRAEGIYGSSLKTRGFSGYLCEILIHEYGGFRELLENASEWREREVVDPEDYHEEGLPGELEEKFSDDSLVVVDPVDPERNVASVLTEENYCRFIFRSWKFLENMGLNFFEEDEVELDRFELKKEIKARGDFIVLEFPAIEEPDDIVYPQMRKAMKRIREVLQSHEFRVFESGFHVGEKMRIFLEMESELPEIEHMKGPKVYHGTDHLEQFTEKYENTFVEGERLKAKTEREYTRSRELLKDFLKSSSAELREKGIPGNVADAMQKLNFEEPLLDDEEWLKFLVRKLRVQ
jgi:tRNA nucleotidyltransferase (CCA-adding enzyme)